MNLKNKRILITAGPTWVPIDQVRVISNIATGKTGILLAEKLENIGARVTLLLGPVEDCCLSKKIKLISFKFFNDLKNAMMKELGTEKYDILIHSAAVSDYRPKLSYSGKVKSGIRQWRLDLVPTPKIIGLLKKIDASVFLVGFKFQPHSSRDKLINQARILMNQSGADLVVANTVYNGHYNAYIVSPKKAIDKIASRSKLVKALIKEIGDALCRNQN